MRHCTHRATHPVLSATPPASDIASGEKQQRRIPPESCDGSVRNAVGLWGLGLGPGVIDILQRQVELKLVGFPIPAVLRAAIGQNAQ